MVTHSNVGAQSERTSKVRSFEDLEVWQLGKELTVLAYEIARYLPDSEAYGLGSQIKRAALSIPANIAEGFGRYHYLDRIKFFLNARGSLNELKSRLLIGKELGFFRDAQIEPTLQGIENLSIKLNNLITATRRTQKKEKRYSR